MKKSILITLGAVLLLLMILFVPFSRVSYDDGGTVEYEALFCKTVLWNRLDSNGTYKNNRIYFGKDRLKTIDALWETEKSTFFADVSSDKTFRATVLEVYPSGILVSPLPEEKETASCDKISFSTALLEHVSVAVGDVVEICFTGEILETYPAQIQAISLRIVDET